MKQDMLTDEQVEMEIQRLNQSPHVRLAQKEQRMKAKRRRWLYDLKWLEKRGKQLEAMGVTADNMEAVLFPAEDDGDA